MSLASPWRGNASLIVHAAGCLCGLRLMLQFSIYPVMASAKGLPVAVKSLLIIFS
jgi:hypothetical protein